MDEFKQHMQQRADELDTDVPRERVWQAINQDLQPVKRSAVLVYMKWGVAACIIGLVGFGLYKLHEKLSKKGKNNESIYENSDSTGIFMTVAGVIYLFVMLVFILCIDNIVDGFFNPEYWALHKIMNLLK